MTPAGYSGTPLVRKLGIKPGFRARLIDAPPHYGRLVGPMPDGVTIARTTRGPFDFIHLFATGRPSLARRVAMLRHHLAPAGMLWVSWPKRTSPLATDLDENAVRRLGLDAGLVDIKVCAVDDDWSGLKFVIPVKDRA